MKTKEITISAKASKDYQSVSRTYTIEVEDDDDITEVEQHISQMLEELHEVVAEDVENLCQSMSEDRATKQSNW